MIPLTLPELPESKVIAGKVVAAPWDEYWAKGRDYTWAKAGFFCFGWTNINFLYNLDMTVFKTTAPSLLLGVGASKTLNLDDKCWWGIGIQHKLNLASLKVDFWHRDTRSSGLGIWEKCVWIWRYDQAVLTKLWGVDAGGDAANTWIQVTGLNIPLGVADAVFILFGWRAMQGITNAAINIWYDDIRIYST